MILLNRAHEEREGDEVGAAHTAAGDVNCLCLCLVWGFMLFCRLLPDGP